jgi:DNA-binding XRE family transcriptional regulator
VFKIKYFPQLPYKTKETLKPSMSLNTDNIRLVFGLKLKQLRLDKAMSLTELAQKSGLSMSYINEIEKGKKYPKSALTTTHSFRLNSTKN